MSRRRFLGLSAGLGGAALVGRVNATAAAVGQPDRAPVLVRRGDRFELTIDSLPVVANPFDPRVAEVWGDFVDSHGVETRVPGFYFQDYTRALVNGRERLRTDGLPVWKIRFTPTRAGSWTWRWTARIDGREMSSGAPQRFVVVDAAAPGFVRRSGRDDRYLVHDDGSPVFLIGENVAWYDDQGTFDYDRWFGRLREQHANFARLWMPYWAFSLEAPVVPLGDYTRRLDRAWQLDYVFDLADASGIMLMLSLQNHGPFSLVFNSEWDQNPYNAANGGPLARPQDFFTDATARRLFQQRLRYCVARWSYAPQLLAWELWNEVDLTAGYDAGVVASWHHDMASYLRLLDPNQHLVTSSLAFYPSVVDTPADGALWDDAGLDFTQVHRYTTIGADIPVGDTDVSHDLPQLVHEMLGRHRGPTLVSEYGVNSQSAADTATLDPSGVALHDALWSSALSGALGAAMTWWWDAYIDASPDRFYPMFGALVRFVAGVQWDEQNFVTTTATVTATTPELNIYGLDGTDVRLLWIKNDAHQWNHANNDQIETATCNLGTRRGEHWRGQWWDTNTGTALKDIEILPTSDGHLAVPPFVNDIALRLTRQPTGPQIPNPTH